MNTLRSFICLLICINSFIVLSAQVDLYNQGDTWEEWNNQVKYSSSSRVGLVVNQGPVELPFLYLIKYDSIYNWACVSVTSIDGRYTANMEYDISKEEIGVVSLKWPTSHLEDLKKFKEGEVTILAYLGKSCYENRKWTVGSFKNIDLEKVEEVVLYLKNEKGVAIASENSNKETEIIECEEILDSDPVSYNWKCNIPTHLITEEHQLYILSKKRKNGKYQTQTEEIEIKIQ